MLQYRAKFNFIGIEEKELGIKNVNRLINEFFELRNIFVDDVNPMYDIWNKDYPDKVSGEDDEKYNSYIEEKHRPYIRKANEEAVKRKYVLRLDSFRHTDVCGAFKIKGKVCKIYLTLVPSLV